MKRTNLSIADFAAVLALHDTMSFRAAAATLAVSPSGLSRQVAAIEARIGVRLYDRDTRSVVPTAAGAALARIARRTLHAVDDGMSEFDAYLSTSNGRLTIAGLPSVTAALLPPLLKTFALKHPGIDVRVIDGLSTNVLDAVESGVADLGFTAGTAQARKRLNFSPVMDDAFVAIGARDGPLGENRAYAWAEIVKLPLIVMAQGTSVRDLIDAACLRINAPLAPRFEVSHLVTAGAFASAGLGITALPTLTLTTINMDGLVRRDIPDFGARRRIGLVQRIGRSPSPAAAAFVELVRKNQSGALSALSMRGS